MYPRIPWELVTDPSGSAEHTSGSSDLDYADDVHSSVEILNTVKKNAEALLRASRQGRSGSKCRETKCIFMYRERNSVVNLVAHASNPYRASKS